MTEHSFYMERAIQLAKRGTGFTNPNPLVGAVIVKDHRIIGEGWHARYGDLHAERNALKHCTEDPAGATMYVTLEPCCHHGKQPPCTEALVESGIRRVYIGSRDFNPLVFGKGVQYLEEHGIEVIPDFLREACDKLNPIFFRYQNALYYFKICHDCRRQDRLCRRGFQMGNWRSCPCPCSTDPKAGGCGLRWHRHSTGRRSHAHLPL